jgi:hypothetical protein
MTFPTDKGVAKDLGELIALVAELKKVLTRSKQTLSTGSINSDHLLEFLSEARRLGVKIQKKATELSFGTTAQNGLEGSLIRLLQALNTVAQNVSSNLPQSNGYVLLYSVNENFELVPREFTGASITLFGQQVDLILAEIE